MSSNPNRETYIYNTHIFFFLSTPKKERDRFYPSIRDYFPPVDKCSVSLYNCFMVNKTSTVYYKDPIKGKLAVGRLIKKPRYRIFKKKVNPKKHLMKIMDAYGIQKEVFDKYLRGRKGRVEINEKDGNYLVASIKTWTKHGKNGNYGDGKQVFLSRKFMHNSKDFNRQTVGDVSMPLDVMVRLKEEWDKKYSQT